MVQENHKTKAATILIVTPTFGKTGSEIALANLIECASDKDINFVIYVHWGIGELRERFTASKEIFVFPLIRWLAANRICQFLNRKIFSQVIFRWFCARFNPDLVYVNTITQPHILRMHKAKKFRLILHTHELEPMFAGLSEKQTRELIGKPDFVIAASERAAQVFRTLGRTKDMAVIRSPIDFQSLQRLQPAATNRHPARESFTWLMAGSLDANKNPVRFVEIARKYLMKRKHDRFVWLGGQTTGYALYAQSLAKQYGLAGRVDWIQPKDHDDYLSRFAATHGVIITSDVESLSLVAIEALAMGKPVVSFDNGGTKEILNHKHGVLVPKYDIDLCVTKMIAIARGRLRFSPDELKKRAKEFDVSRVKDRWLQILENVGKH